MSSNRVSDDVVDSIRMIWRGQPGDFLVHVDVSSGDAAVDRVLIRYLTVLQWSDVQFLAERLAAGRSGSTDLRGYFFPEVLLPADKPLMSADEVGISDGLDETLFLSRAGFFRLMIRWFRVLIQGATAADHDVTHSQWWPTLVSHVTAIEDRASVA